jgi:hypothetical protein
MAIYKRRIVYFSDDEWRYIRERADLHGMSASAYIRSVFTSDGHVVPTSEERAKQDRFNTRPFTPVPKPGSK